MTPSHLRILADLILPGDEAGLPPGSLIPDVMAVLAQSTSPIRTLTADHPHFADVSKRQAILMSLEAERPQEFRDFVLSLIKAYYESGHVLEAMGWRSAPPQPEGHKIAPMDESLAPALAKVAERKRLWR